MSGRPRLLFVGAFPPPGTEIFGGMVTSCRALLSAGLSNAVDVDLVDTTQVSHPPPGLLVRCWLSIPRFARYVRSLERNRPDAVLLFASTGASLVEKGVMAWYARLRGVRAMLFPRGGSLVDACRDAPFTRMWVRWTCRGAHKLLCQSRRWQEFAVGTLGFHRENAPIVENWTASEELLAIGRARGARAPGPIRLLFLGWLERSKGVEELIKACAQLAPAREFVLDIAGDGGWRDQAAALTDECGLATKVRFSGWLRDEALRTALANADVLVLPSWAEGLPNAMIEAMAARLAIVVSAVGSVPDVVVHDRHALLVAPRDIGNLRDALARVIDDGTLREHLADAAYHLAVERFSGARAVAAIASLTQDAVYRPADVA